MIKQFIPQEICLECQGCCRFSQRDSVWSPSLLNEEVEELLKNKIPPLFISSDKKILLRQPAAEGNFVCSFFTPEENLCKIYPWRPFECQLYPFLINRKGGKVFLALDLHCPFVAKKIKTRDFEDCVLYLTEFLNSPPQAEILKNNPQIIQVYPQALNLGELKI
jgi:Fe-S-cluster containining protein